MKKGIFDLWPKRVDSYSNKKTFITKMHIDGQSILIELLYVVCAISKGRGENSPFAQVIDASIHICNNSIGQTLI